jgi:hypothetical protein
MLKNGLKYLLNYYVLLVLIFLNGIVLSSIKITLSNLWPFVIMACVILALAVGVWYSFYRLSDDEALTLNDVSVKANSYSNLVSLKKGLIIVIITFFFMILSSMGSPYYFSEWKLKEIGTVVSLSDEINSRLDIMLEQQNISVVSKSVDVNISNIKHIMDSNMVFATKDPKEALAMYEHVKSIDENMQVVGDVIKHKYDLLTKIKQTGLDKVILSYTGSFLLSFDNISIDKDLVQMNIDYYIIYQVLYYIEMLLIALYVVIFVMSYIRHPVDKNSVDNLH